MGRDVDVNAIELEGKCRKKTRKLMVGAEKLKILPKFHNLKTKSSTTQQNKKTGREEESRVSVLIELS